MVFIGICRDLLFMLLFLCVLHGYGMRAGR